MHLPLKVDPGSVALMIVSEPATMVAAVVACFGSEGRRVSVLHAPRELTRWRRSSRTDSDWNARDG